MLIGLASTIWFLVRVIPKPQRAAYPCMRTAAPLMSGFVIYLLSLGGSLLFFRKAIANLKKAKYWAAIGAIAISFVLVVIFNINDVKQIYANTLGIQWTRGVLPDAPNTPMGTAWGIKPGRVAWVWNPAATRDECTNMIVSTGGWNGVMDLTKSDAYFQAKNTNQDTINMLANKAIMLIGGESTVKASWDAIFKNFNKKKTGTESGYVAGQKIFIKVNNGQAGWAIYSDLSEKGNSGQGVGNAMSNTSPQAVLAFLVQLIDSCGVAQSDIIIGEPMSHVYKSMADIVWPMYPKVIIIDKDDKTSLGRTTSSGWVSNAIVWSDKGKVMPSAINDDMMQEMYDADYLINISALKAHARSGVSLSAKNHFGSSSHGGSYCAERLHAGSIATGDMNTGNDDLSAAHCRGDYHMYRVLTDIMGHEKLGGNTVLFVVDGLWSGIEATDMPVKWGIAPFNNDWPSSLFVSQDEVALESVCLDFLRAEADKNTKFKDRPFFPAVDDFLHQAADPANWPTTVKDIDGKSYPFAGYDPEGDGTYMKSLGVHEHWDNPINKQYSRNISADGKGIELVSYPSGLVSNKTAIKVSQVEASLNAYPNPVVNSCFITYQLKASASVSLFIASTDGRMIEYIEQKQLAAGSYTKTFDASKLKSGAYVCVLKARYNGRSEIKSLKLQVR
ncbi:MAG TPA: DUF362 domain-containing protein [Bacteroidales bacterium]